MTEPDSIVTDTHKVSGVTMQPSKEHAGYECCKVLLLSGYSSRISKSAEPIDTQTSH